MAQAVIDIDREVPDHARTILTSVPGVAVRAGRRRNALVVNRRTWSLLLVASAPRLIARAQESMFPTLAGPDKLGFVVADRLPEHVRRDLESAGYAYADGTGAAHIDVPGFFVHVEGKPSRRQTLVAAPKGVGVTGVRTVQALLGEPEREWSVPALATAAACSHGEAHRVMTRLQGEGLMTSHGRARSLRRTVTSPAELLDWLSSVPSARRIRERLDAFLYATDPAALVATLTRRASQAGLEYALTGTAAAHAFGARITSAVPVTMVRIAPATALEEACSILKAEQTDRGANLLLVRDVGRVGVHGRTQTSTALLAPPVRVWLDILDEPRGEDAAALFRESVIGW